MGAELRPPSELRVQVTGIGLSWLVFELLLRPLLFGVDQGRPLLWIGVGAGMLLLIGRATLPSAVRAAPVRVGPSIGSS